MQQNGKITNEYMKSTNKYKCGCCDTISIVGDILKAPNPFNVHDELWGCPHCFAAEDFLRVCDGNGCNSTSVAGIPISDMYLFLCRDHASELELMIQTGMILNDESIKVLTDGTE